MRYFLRFLWVKRFNRITLSISLWFFIEPIFQFGTFINKLIFTINFVRHKWKFKIEKILWFCVFEFFWFMNIFPQSIYIIQKLLSGRCYGVSFELEITNYKKKFFISSLSKQFQIALKNDLEETIVACLVTTKIWSPHIN